MFVESAHSLAMITHSMRVVKSAVEHVNLSQTPVITLDQLLFALAKQIQWTLAEFSEAKFVVMLEGLHMEVASFKILGKWLSGSGWADVMWSAGVAMQGVAESFLLANHVTRTRQSACQVMAASLHILMNKAHSEYQAKSRENEQENKLSKEERKDAIWQRSHRSFSTGLQCSIWN